MELLAFGGANLVWHPRPARDELFSVFATHDHLGTCKIFANRVSVVGRRPRGESHGHARKAFEARGYNSQDGYSSAPETASSSRNQGNRTTRRPVSRLATENGIVDREIPQPGDMFIAPLQTGRVGGMRAARTRYDEEDFSITNLRHSQQKPAENMGARTPSALTSIALAAIPFLLIAPLMGFIARCVVDYIHAHIEDEVGKRFAEMESWQARHRPRVKRWQTILDGDRDEDEQELPTTSAISDYQYQSDPWSINGHQPTISRDVTEIDTWHHTPSDKETEEDRKLRQRFDYEEIKRSYTKLEPMYEKFLADSGLTGSGYWRGAGES